MAYETTTNAQFFVANRSRIPSLSTYGVAGLKQAGELNVVEQTESPVPAQLGAS